MYFLESNNESFPKTIILCDASTGRVFKTGRVIPDSECRLWKNRGHKLIGPLNTSLMVFFVVDDSPTGDERVRRSIQNLRVQKDRDRVSQAYELWKKNPDLYLYLSSQGDKSRVIETDAMTFMPSQETPAFIPPAATGAASAPQSSGGTFSAHAELSGSSATSARVRARSRAGGGLFIRAVVASVTSSGAEEKSQGTGLDVASLAPREHEEQSEQTGPENHVDRPTSKIARAIVRAQIRRLIR